MTTNGSRSFSSGALLSTGALYTTESEQGLLDILRAVHKSSLDQELKNELRNLVFSLQSGETDESALRTALTTAGLLRSGAMPVRTPNPQNVSAGEAPLGHTRMTPQFGVRSTMPSPAVISTPTADISETKEASASNVHHVRVNKIVPQPQPAAVEQPNQASPVTAPEENNPAVTEAAARIKEIKHTINEKVGNPITLIDKDQTIGREYMNALLAALKASNGATTDELQKAMSRLEKAFVNAQALVETSAAVPSAPATSVAPHDASEISKKPAEPTPAPVPPVFAATKESDLVTSPQTVVQAPVPETHTINAANDHTPSSEENNVSVAPEKEAPSGRMISVAKEKQLQQLMQQNRAQTAAAREAEEVSKRAATDPLLLPEITAGLEQLLSEWSLFRSSGFFGTGPNGVAHPLYLTLATLPMASVVAGRFEGATPQVRQSISDYMNGWRYEEGIMHDHSETFEHYLRRVIGHILDKRKRLYATQKSASTT